MRVSEEENSFRSEVQQNGSAGSDRDSPGPFPLHTPPKFRSSALSPARGTSLTFSRKNMSAKSRDTRERARLVLNAFVEALVGIFALRLPAVQEVICRNAPEMSVESSYPGQSLILDAKRTARECQTNGPDIRAVVDQIVFAFVASLWDTLLCHAHYERISTKPEIQFFRHLRNAGAHDGRWNFTELKHPARWRDKELTLQHSGQLVFGGVLKHGDVALLFIDIDKVYFEQPQMQAEQGSRSSA